MKQKYVIPTIEYVGTFFETAILAGSNPPGGASSGQGNESTTDVGGEGGEEGPPETSSKDHNFNAWETWDEY